MDLSVARRWRNSTLRPTKPVRVLTQHRAAACTGFWHSKGKGTSGPLESAGGLVGAGRFERPTPCAQGRCATRLRYAPTFSCSFDSKTLFDSLPPRILPDPKSLAE